LLICAKELFVEATQAPQTLRLKEQLPRRMNEPVTLCVVAGTLALLGLFLYIVATEKYEKRV